MWKDFKKFAVKGNIMDLAIGVIIGGAFGKIVTSLVNDIIMPVFGLVLGGINFTKLQFEKWGTIIKYGNFIQSIVDFVIISFSIFIFIRAISRLKRNEEEKTRTAEPSKEELLLAEIRDILKSQNQRNNL
jgi:large conductance mechanosensitive channel